MWVISLNTKKASVTSRPQLIKHPTGPRTFLLWVCPIPSFVFSDRWWFVVASLPVSCVSQNRLLLDTEIAMFREFSCTLPILQAVPAQWMSKLPHLYWFLLAPQRAWGGQWWKGRVFDSLDYCQNLFNFQNFPRVYLANFLSSFSILLLISMWTNNPDLDLTVIREHLHSPCSEIL